MTTTGDTAHMHKMPGACTGAVGCASSCRRVGAIPLTLLLVVVAAGTYAFYERMGTVANADVVEFTPNLAGGFLAVGVTETQPGFVLLSALDRNQVEVHVDQLSSPLAGTHTIVEIQTVSATLRHRLRGPQIILVDEEGAIDAHAVDWMIDDFDAVRKAADCSHEAAIKKRRCGAPFRDLHEAFARWPASRIPHPVRTFLKPFADRRTRKTKN